MVTRIGDAAQSDRITSLIQSTTARVRASQTAASTGKAVQRYDEIGADAGLLVRTKDQRALAQTYVRQNEQVGDRLTAMDGAMAGLGGIAERMKALLTQRLADASGQLVPVDREAGTLLAEAAAQLNLKLDERHLFAGSRADAPPVALPNPAPTSADPALYYRGDAVIVSVRADRDVEVPYGVTADDPAFANLLGALGKAAEAHRTNDRGGLQAAMGMLDTAVGGLAELRGEMAATGARLETITDGRRGAVVYLDEIVSRIEDTDIPQALTRLAQDQASLEAAYLATTRIGQLSLADFLR